MVVRGVYSEAELKMFELWKATQYPPGWLEDEPSADVKYPVYHRVATKDLFVNMANGIPDLNPLWRDDNYARKTRWGGIIAPPLFEHCITHNGRITHLAIPPELGRRSEKLAGLHWEFFKPIKVGDSFRVWQECSYEDITSVEGNGLRTFLTNDKSKYINQKNEIVCIKDRKVRVTIIDSSMKRDESSQKMEQYKYTQLEMDFIDRVRDEEIIRGADIRWWDNVKEGDNLQPVIGGPFTLWDQCVCMGGLGILVHTTNRVRKLTPGDVFQDPETGVWHKGIENHLDDKVAYLVNRPQASVIGVLLEHTLTRVITNWMGDDGFIKIFDHKPYSVWVPLGDTVFGRGKVIKKYILDDGEHVVDIAVWLEGLRGYMHDMGKITVGLMSKDSCNKDLLRY